MSGPSRQGTGEHCGLATSQDRPLPTVFCSPQRRVLSQRRPFPLPSESAQRRRSLIGWLSADEKHVLARAPA
jgi:hypothetical protein